MKTSKLPSIGFDGSVPVAYRYGTTEPMGYFDGNTVTGLVELRSVLRHERQLLWHYLRTFKLGVINLVSGQTNGAVNIINGLGDEVSGGPDGSYTLIGDADPRYDVCSSSTRNQAQMSGLQYWRSTQCIWRDLGWIYGRILSPS